MGGAAAKKPSMGYLHISFLMGKPRRSRCAPFMFPSAPGSDGWAAAKKLKLGPGLRAGLALGSLHISFLGSL